jgi:hypothetical protein
VNLGPTHGLLQGRQLSQHPIRGSYLSYRTTKEQNLSDRKILHPSPVGTNKTLVSAARSERG